MKIKKNIKLDYNSYLEFEKIGIGAFNPLKGFMDEKNFYSVVENMRLINGTIFPIPVVFAIQEEEKKKIKKETPNIIFFVFYTSYYTHARP